MTDIRGKTILSQTIEQGQSSSDFDMSGMSKGYYVVILDTHTGSISRNIIME
ncbi:MAG: T9SS type A sorting domain-containing protein [Candidatus Kapaibacterium sp.]